MNDKQWWDDKFFDACFSKDKNGFPVGVYEIKTRDAVSEIISEAQRREREEIVKMAEELKEDHERHNLDCTCVGLQDVIDAIKERR